MLYKELTIVIVNGANLLGVHLVEQLLEQKYNVIVVDDFSESNMPFIKRFADKNNFVFIEKDKINTLKENFTRINYFIHLKHDFDTSNDELSSKQFINETKFIDEVLTIASEKKSIYLLTSSLHLHKDFLSEKHLAQNTNGSAYTEADLQDYVERIVKEYIKKNGLNGRIVRLGNIYGPDMDLNKDPLLKQIISDVLNKDSIRIYGDGLEYMYYIYITDAVIGILKALFYEKSINKVYSITHPDEVSVLTIVHKVLALNNSAKTIKFIKTKQNIDPLYAKSYIPDENLSEIGWKPLVNFDRGISQVFAYFENDPSLKFFDSVNKIGEVRNLPENISENKINKDKPKIEFDDTLNFSDSNIHSYDHYTQQFHNVYDKLNTEDSPLYNSKKKRNSIDKEKKKVKITFSNVAKKATFAATLLMIYIFFLTPLIRFGFLFNDMKISTKTLNASIETGFNSELINKNLGETAKNNFAAINWAVEIFKQQKLRDDIINLANGVDLANKAASKIKTNNIEAEVNSTKSIPEVSVNDIQEIRSLLSEANTNLSSINSINLPSSTDTEIEKLRIWIHDTDVKLSGIPTTDQKVLGTTTNDIEE